MPEEFAWRQNKKVRRTRTRGAVEYPGGETVVWQPMKARGHRAASAAPRAKPVGELLRDKFYSCGFCKGEGMKPEGTKCPVCKAKGWVKVNPPAVKCAFCRGRGSEKPRSLVTCLVCKGKGVVSVKEPVEVCSECNGGGRKTGEGLYCGQCRGAGVVHVEKEEIDQETGEVITKHFRSPSGTPRDICKAIYQLGGEAGRAEIANRERITGAYAEFVLKDMVGKGWLTRYDRDMYALTKQTENFVKEMEQRDLEKINPQDIQILTIVQEGAGEYKIKDVAKKLRMRDVFRCNKACTKLAKTDFMDVSINGRTMITPKGERAIKEGPKAAQPEEPVGVDAFKDREFFQYEL